VLDADVHALLDDAVADLLVDLDTDGAAGDVEHDTRAAVVRLVGHTLVEGTVHHDVDVVTHAVARQVRLQAQHVAVLAVRPCKGIAGARAVTVGVAHLDLSARSQRERGRQGTQVKARLSPSTLVIGNALTTPAADCAWGATDGDAAAACWRPIDDDDRLATARKHSPGNLRHSHATAPPPQVPSNPARALTRRLDDDR